MPDGFIWDRPVVSLQTQIAASEVQISYEMRTMAVRWLEMKNLENIAVNPQ